MILRENLKFNLEQIQQKARERTVKTQNIEYDLETLVKRISKGSIKLDPDYQRRHRWSNEMSSRLVESLILNIPIPVIFISQDVDVDEETDEATSRYTVIDGQQRLTAIFDFMKGEYPLEGLEVLEELNGSFYKDLPPFLFRRLEERTVKCLRIDSTVDSQVKYDIFERLNTGSVKLEPQELRNAVARGPFNDAIKKMAEFEDFRRCIRVDLKDPESSAKVKKMEDVELVLRFFALRGQGYTELKKSFRDHLTWKQNEFNKLSDDEIAIAGIHFRSYMSFFAGDGKGSPFAKLIVTDGGVRQASSFNAAVYDAMAIGFANVFNVNEINNRRDELYQKFVGLRGLFADQDFSGAISGSVNDAQKVKVRIEMVVAKLRA
ncbi:TPA: DUF262 domain-containing protein [Stenotrophomonas maltophilia]|uniref:DUF262 domain-containing protein n=1 Tax=Stenotrophomonas maltophilia TaxID=40324 RepID=A0AAJ2JBY9_STEMA|nr:DUF262 domain-containing protein [Stenotrophomonas maltophilia]MDT3468257.1 DUF262 domain-containing protein [Stenotrophomonas maltophilia]HEL3815769.1 DUF262 domain-containing protein [Stenotrophomonas maltophilia]